MVRTDPVASWRQLLSDERMLDREGSRHVPELWTACSPSGVVASAHYRATRAGAAILQAGGNAVDAAVATSFALAVVEPAGSGLGGMATIMLHLGTGTTAFLLPGSCPAPALATPEAVRSSPRYSGYRAVAVPTYLSVLDTVLRCHGTISVEEALAPAIELAERGFPLTRLQSDLIAGFHKHLVRSSAGSLFLAPDGSPPAAGTWLRQQVLAATLRRLARAGLRDLYEGEIAQLIAADMERHGGFLRAGDLAAVGEPPPTEPVATPWGGAVVCTAGPPAGGRALLEMLNLATILGPHGIDADSPEGVELLAAIIRRARSDRRRYRRQRAGDPDLGSLDYARSIAPRLSLAMDEGETSHISAIDAAGNAVALTQSIERSFGARVVTPGLGFLYNGYLRGFKIEALQHPHYLRPGAVARSNAAPTIVVDNGKARLAIGSTGSERMISGIFQVLVRLQRQTPFAAVHAPRLHATPEGEVLIEEARFPPQCLQRLRKCGYTISVLDPYSFKTGGLHLAMTTDAGLVGVAEPRRDGAAAGPDGPVPQHPVATTNGDVGRSTPLPDAARFSSGGAP